jgi:hypothetical protein
MQFLVLPNEFTNSVGIKIQKVICVSKDSTTEDKIDLSIVKKYVKEKNLLLKF